MFQIYPIFTRDIFTFAFFCSLPFLHFCSCIEFLFEIVARGMFVMNVSYIFYLNICINIPKAVDFCPQLRQIWKWYIEKLRQSLFSQFSYFLLCMRHQFLLSFTYLLLPYATVSLSVGLLTVQPIGTLKYLLTTPWHFI